MREEDPGSFFIHDIEPGRYNDFVEDRELPLNDDKQILHDYEVSRPHTSEHPKHGQALRDGQLRDPSEFGGFNEIDVTELYEEKAVERIQEENYFNFHGDAVDEFITEQKGTFDVGNERRSRGNFQEGNNKPIVHAQHINLDQAKHVEQDGATTISQNSLERQEWFRSQHQLLIPQSLLRSAPQESIVQSSQAFSPQALRNFPNVHQAPALNSEANPYLQTVDAHKQANASPWVSRQAAMRYTSRNPCAIVEKTTEQQIGSVQPQYTRNESLHAIENSRHLKIAQQRLKEEQIKQLAPELAVHVWARYKMDSRISERFSAFSKANTQGDALDRRGETRAGSTISKAPTISTRDETRSLGGIDMTGSSPSSSSNVRTLYSCGSGISRNMEVNYLPPSERTHTFEHGRGGLTSQRSGPIDTFAGRLHDNSRLKRSISEVVEPIAAQQLHAMLHDLPEGKEIKKITRRATEPLDSFHCQVKGPMPTLEGFMERHRGSLNENKSRFSHLKPRAIGHSEELDLRNFLKTRLHSSSNSVCHNEEVPADNFVETTDSDFAALDRALQQERSQYHGDVPY